MAIFLDTNESDDGEIQFSANFHIWGKKIECKHANFGDISCWKRKTVLASLGRLSRVERGSCQKEFAVGTLLGRNGVFGLQLEWRQCGEHVRRQQKYFMESRLNAFIWDNVCGACGYYLKKVADGVDKDLRTWFKVHYGALLLVHVKNAISLLLYYSQRLSTRNSLRRSKIRS